MSGIDSTIIQSVIEKNRLKAVTETKRFTSGVVNRVYALGNEYVLKIEGEGGVPDEPILKPAADLTSRLLDKGARVPRVLDYGEVDGTEYILMETATGTNAASDWMSFSDKQRETLIEQLAEQLQIWHSIHFDKYCITLKSRKYFDNLQSAIERVSLKEIALIRKDKLSKEFVAGVDILEKFYYDHTSDLNETGTAVLIHNDIHLENIFYKGDKLTSIIDLDWISQAPKDYELWKILDTFHAPKYTVEETLEPLYEGYQMTKEFKWLRKYYSDLFETKDMANRIRLYYVGSLAETVIDYQNGLWGTRALEKLADKIRDFYQNHWLERMLE